MSYFICEKQGRCCPHEFYNSIEQAITDSEDGVPCDHLIEVESVRHGRWISWEKAGNFVPSSDRHECSVCHDAAQVLVNGFELLSDYCPNCGAKMMEG